jgi:streptomycin 6-kinase
MTQPLDSIPTMPLKISAGVMALCHTSHERTAWLNRLPDLVEKIMLRWSLQFDQPLEGEEASCSFVAAVRDQGGIPAVLKIGVPHMEAQDEIKGLQFWNGDPTVRLLAVDTDVGAMLLERCRPGTTLRRLPEADQDVVIASLLPRLWRKPAEPRVFRPLSAMLEHWTKTTLEQSQYWPDVDLVREGLQLFHELPTTAASEVLLATDLHAGNVLAAEREPWLVIDPKPFLGDPAFDATQHLFNCSARLQSDPVGLIRSFANLLAVEAERVRLWTFARLAAEPCEDWNNFDNLALARKLRTARV